MKLRLMTCKATQICVMQAIAIIGFSSVLLLFGLIHGSRESVTTSKISKIKRIKSDLSQRNASQSSASFKHLHFTNASNLTGIANITPVVTIDLPSQNEQVVKKVFSLVYFKGGSTFLGRLFASNPETFYWFEIVQPIYLAMMGLMTIPYDELYNLQGERRNQTPEELSFIYEHLNKFYNCDLDKLPIEMVYQDSVTLSGVEWDPFISCFKGKTGHQTWQYFTNQCLKKYLPASCKTNAEQAINVDCLNTKFLLEGKTPTKLESHLNSEILAKMKNYWNCLHKSPIQSSFDKCIVLAKHECEQRSIRAVKVMRMRLIDTEELVKRDPNFKVIHQLRDPRGALMSAKSINMFSRHSRKSIAEEAKIVCGKMLEDIRAYRTLKEKYPENYIQTKYENLADHPLDTVELIYNHIGSSVPQDVKKHLSEITHGKTEPRLPGSLDTHRKNSSQTAHRWRLRITKHEKALLDKICLRAIQEGGYTI